MLINFKETTHNTPFVSATSSPHDVSSLPSPLSLLLLSPYISCPASSLPFPPPPSLILPTPQSVHVHHSLHRSSPCCLLLMHGERFTLLTVSP